MSLIQLQDFYPIWISQIFYLLLPRFFTFYSPDFLFLFFNSPKQIVQNLYIIFTVPFNISFHFNPFSHGQGNSLFQFHNSLLVTSIQVEFPKIRSNHYEKSGNSYLLRPQLADSMFFGKINYPLILHIEWTVPLTLNFPGRPLQICSTHIHQPLPKKFHTKKLWICL